MSFIPYPRNYRNGSVVIDNAQIGTNTKTLNGNTDQYFDKSIELNRTYGGYKKYWMGMIGEGNKTSVGGVPNDNNSFGICVDNGSVAEPEVLLELNKDGDLRIRGDIYIAGEVINVTNEHIQVEDISSNTYKFNGSESSIYKDNNDIVINNEQGDIRLSAGNVTMHGALNVEGYILDINRNDNNTTSLIRAGKNGSTNGQLVIQHDRRIVFDKLSDSSNPNVEINTQTGELRCASLIVDSTGDLSVTGNSTVDGNLTVNQFFRVGNTSQPGSDIVLFSNSPGDAAQSRFVTEGKQLFIQNNTSINFGSIGNAGVVSINTTNGNLSVTGNSTVDGNLSVAGTVSSSSDIRLKENITNLNNSLDKISNIRGVNYNLKNDETKTKTAGVIAQELLEQIPEAVNDSDSEHLRVNYNAIIPYLIESVKELKREIDDLKANNI